MTFKSILFCIVVIAILAAVLFPVFAEPTRRDMTPIRCLSNTKQLTLASQMYAGDYNDRLPMASTWMSGIYPYTRNTFMFRCPLLWQQKNFYGYAMNSGFSEAAISKIEQPEKAILIFESTLLQMSASSTLATLPNPGRHDGKNSVAFASGKAAFLPIEP